jgi:hypothetical protein
MAICGVRRACQNTCLPTAAHSIRPSNFWRISSTVGPTCSYSARLCHKNGPFVSSGQEALYRAVREALVECCPLPVHACFLGGPDLIGSRLQRNAFEDSPDWLKQICLKLEKALQDLPVLGCQEQFGSNRERLHRSRR